MVLLEKAGIEVDELNTLIVAGGFGYFLNPQHAATIGLLPNVPQEKIVTIGNACLGGLSVLLQSDYTEEIEQLRARCETVELNLVPSFKDHYTDCLLIE